uniref:Uncharacterized protein n=1 Tax=Candidatus Kentrum sp. MB TaxID=2138164 RepID=A0A451BBM6_9GAMM|nr:MAG: hypothetical protein BECKMB1821G_GA0114241_102923 [Candidatus Kentron sp. MB]VFK33041.1 MAG: hypothetical protein BECKMB1821I_GA0114274_103924 [Candidatus Kentron sp. MB]VFK75706.1 MAG: hypothetical protein BECKMB1821H_GA0114242_102924 [Candidatus Kentron sp. MB]
MKVHVGEDDQAPLLCFGMTKICHFERSEKSRNLLFLGVMKLFFMNVNQIVTIKVHDKSERARSLALLRDDNIFGITNRFGMTKHSG